MIKCKQCGEIKATTNFRRYYGEGDRGHYKTCASCETVNNRYKYLNKKVERTEKDEAELADINVLFDLLRNEGLRPPSTKQANSVMDHVQAMINSRKNKQEEAIAVVEGATATTPQPLLDWFTKDLQDFEPWELQDIFDDLEDAYRPKIGVTDTFAPVFDETNKPILDKLELHFGL